nr:hypothetical protein [Tepidiforma sp.]
MFVDEDVLRLDVGMDNTEAMGVGEGVGDLPTEPDYLPFREAAMGCDQLAKGIAVDVFRNDIAPAFMFAGIVNGDDVRVLQASDHARLALEGCDRLRVDSRR